MSISTALIRDLRERTGAGILECKRALEETGGDIEAAIELLRQQGLVKAAKKAGRETSQGLVEAYVHGGGRIGVLVEVNCETDFVARTAEFQELAHDLALQVAAMSPLYLDASELPEGSPLDPKEVCLLQQPFIRDQGRTVQERIQETIAKVGENIRVRRFARFEIGE
jgi:elongation factor Ts